MATLTTISKAAYDAIMSEVAESDIPARAFRVVNDILSRHKEGYDGDDCNDSPLTD